MIIQDFFENQLEVGITFQNQEMRDDINWLRSVHYIPKDLHHKFTILTSVRFKEDRQYFTFLTSFQFEVSIII